MDGFSGSVGRIPWTALNEYAKRHPFAEADFDVFNLYISEMDSRFISLVKEKKPKTPPKGDKRSKRVSGMGEPE